MGDDIDKVELSAAVRQLKEEGKLTVVTPPMGRRAGVYKKVEVTN